MKKIGTSYFYKILLLFLVTVLVTSCVLTVFSYEQFSESLKEKAYADYQAGLRKNARTWNDLVSEIGQLASAIAVDPQSENYFSMEEYDPVQEYNTYLKVKKLFNINPFMEAFCLYNPAAECALYCGTDAVRLDIMWEKVQKKNGKVIMRTERTDNKEPLLVFGYPVYVDSFEGPQGAVFLALQAPKASEHVLGGVDYPQLCLERKERYCLSREKGRKMKLSLRGSGSEQRILIMQPSRFGRRSICVPFIMKKAHLRSAMWNMAR